MGEGWRSLEKGLFDSLKVVRSYGRPPTAFRGVSQDSRLIEPGFVFIARTGGATSGWSYIGEAVQRGATLIVSDRAPSGDTGVPYLQVENLRQALVKLSHEVYGRPAELLKVILITGTNGKTSSTFLIKSIIERAGGRCGLVGTIYYDTGSGVEQATLTTPDIDRLCGLMAQMVTNGCTHVVMEASSHALELGRLEGIESVAAGITNITPEHQDFHPSMEAYAAAKAKLFSTVAANGVGVVNLGIPWAQDMISRCRGRVITYGTESSGADLLYRSLEVGTGGGRYSLKGLGRELHIVTTLVGDYQGENAAMCAGIAIGLGIAGEDIAAGIADLKAVPGRMEPVNLGQPFAVYVDYGHTPDALEKALVNLRKLTRGRLICLFGCGGNRDRRKRPMMGKVAAEHADLVFLTSDNPRFEEPEAIILDILGGVEASPSAKILKEADRRRAISRAVAQARNGDVILIAGKGHENYLEIKGVRTPFDDRIVAGEALAEQGWLRAAEASDAV